MVPEMSFIQLKDKLQGALEVSLACNTKEEVEQKFGEELAVFRNGDAYNLDRGALELAFRGFLNQILATSIKKKVPVSDCGAERLIDLSIWCANESVAEGDLVFLLIEDLFQGQTIKECEQLFPIIESRRDVLTQSSFFERGKLPLLRSFVQVLKRLSRAHNTVFCGRLLMFLAYVFPLSDKSGVNLQGTFNVENVTEFEDAEGEEDEQDGAEKMDVDAQLGLDDGTRDAPVDMNFYRKFWGLQKYFINPVKLYEKENWKLFSKAAEVVLTNFAGYNTSSDRQDDDEASVLAGADVSMLDASQVDNFHFAKFLTSSRLLNLQLKDPSFRRHVILQFLILFHHLRVYVTKAPVQGLDTVSQKWVEEHEQKAYLLLSLTTPRGSSFTANIRAMMERENNWVAWKKDHCPVFERPTMDFDNVEEISHKRDPRFSSVAKPLGFTNKNMADIWALGGDMEKNLTKEVSLPSVEEFVQPLKDQLDPDSMVDEKDRLSKDNVFVWKSFRLIAKTHLPLFAKINESQEPLEAMVSEITKDQDDDDKAVDDVDETPTRNPSPVPDAKAAAEPAADAAKEGDTPAAHTPKQDGEEAKDPAEDPMETS